MKIKMYKFRAVLIIILTNLLISTSIFAQSPEKMSYQAVIRNSSDQLITNKAVGMQITIVQGTASGSSVYTETQSPTTNANGLVSIEIGAGTVQNGNFASIDWSAGPYFIKTQTDPAGGTTYTITGTSQLLSTPYALYAKKAESVTGTITETDPVYTSSQAANITATDIANLSNLSGANTGDQDLSSLATKIQLSDSTTKVNTALATKADKLNATQAGQMQYWDGTAWVTVSQGTTGQVLTYINGVPTWATLLNAVTGSSTDVYNPTTGEIWMDRNLGATQVATSSTDAASYGDLYQWGRAADGHQSRTSTTTSTLATSNTPGDSNFILALNTPYDWRNPQNDTLWQGVSGTNNPCPSGYRLPTLAEWDAERTSWGSNNSAGAFASPLKLPVAGNRSYNDGSLYGLSSLGSYWSSTVDGANSRYFFFNSSFAYMNSFSRAYGLSVRCIKD